MSNLTHMSATVYGHVQGVFYRAFTIRIAKSLGLKGYVRNLRMSDGVEVVAEGDKEKIEELIRQLESGPPEALVEKVEVKWMEFTGQYANFDMR